MALPNPSTLLALVVAASSLTSSSAAWSTGTVEIGRSEVVRRLMSSNPDVARASMAVDRARAERAGALAILDPVFDARLDLSYARTPTEAGLSAGVATNERYALSASVARVFSPGTQLSVSLAQAVRRSEFPLRTGIGFGDRSIVSGPDVETSLTVELRQPLLQGFGRDVVLLADRLAARSIDVRELEAVAAAEGAVLEAMIAYTELRYAREELALRERSLERTERALHIAEAEAEAGQIAPIEVDLVRERVAARQEALLVAEAELERRARELARILGDSPAVEARYEPADPIASPPAVAFSERACAEAAEASPTVASLRGQLALADARTVGTRDALRPSLEASAGLTQAGLDEGWAASLEQSLSYDAPTVFGGVVLTMPLRNRAARAEHDVAMADVDAAAYEVEQAEREVCFQVRDAITTLALQEDRLAIAATRVTLSERAVEAESQRFSSGLSTVQAGLDALETLESTEIALLRVRTDAELAWWQLQFVRGRLLEAVGPGPDTPAPGGSVRVEPAPGASVGVDR